MVKNIIKLIQSLSKVNAVQNQQISKKFQLIHYIHTQLMETYRRSPFLLIVQNHHIVMTSHIVYILMIQLKNGLRLLIQIILLMRTILLHLL